MGKGKIDPFSIWLGITTVGFVLSVFYLLVKFRPDFFLNMTLSP